MPSDRYLKPGDRGSGFSYQLGLDRESEEETRSPRVLIGDPAICAALEAINRFTCPSTKYVIGWEEWISDHEIEECSREYVEDVLNAGVPKNFYAHCVIAHDEPAPRPRKKAERKIENKRSAVHGNIINMLLPSAGFLQPMYSVRDRLLTTLYLADVSIKKGWSHPLDKDGIRNHVGFHRNEALKEFKVAIDEAVKGCNRLPNGEPDPVAILAIIERIGMEHIYAVTRIVGQKGIALTLDDHPRQVRFFGEEFECLHNHIKHIEHHEIEGSITRSPGTVFFPGGYLDRSDKYATRISQGLRSWISKRALFNRRRYCIDSPTLVLGGFGRDFPADLGAGDGVADQGKHPPKGPAGLLPGADNKPEDATGSPTEIACEKPSPPNSYGDNTDRHTTEEEWDSDLCGTHEDLRVLAEAIAAVAARMLRSTHRALEDVCGAIGALLEDRVHGARLLAVAGRRFGEKSGNLDAAIERHSLRMVPSAGPEAQASEQVSDVGEFVRRVKRKPVADRVVGMRPISIAGASPGQEKEQLEP